VAPLPPLRSKLLLLAAVGVVPGLILSLVLGYFLIEHEKETFRQAAFARNRTFLTAVDAQMLGYVGTLHALEASASLDTGELESFPGIAVRLPVLRNGELRYVLEFVLEPAALAKLMQSQAYANTWTVGLADGNNRVIARVPALPAGNGISADAQAAISHAPEGWYHGRTVEGRDTYTAYKTSLLTGWTVGLSIPAGELNAAAYKALTSLALGTMVSLLAADKAKDEFLAMSGHELRNPLSSIVASAHVLRLSKPGAAAALQAVLQVRDQGQGIAPEEIPHIFKLFVQGPQSFHRPQGGLGLGLTLVQRLAEMHGGAVSVFSAGRGQGAAFTVRLPVAEAPGRATSSTESRPDEFRPQGRRILLVEDNEDGRHMLHLTKPVAPKFLHDVMNALTSKGQVKG